MLCRPGCQISNGSRNQGRHITNPHILRSLSLSDKATTRPRDFKTTTSTDCTHIASVREDQYPKSSGFAECPSKEHFDTGTFLEVGRGEDLPATKAISRFDECQMTSNGARAHQHQRFQFCCCEQGGLEVRTTKQLGWFLILLIHVSTR